MKEIKLPKRIGRRDAVVLKKFNVLQLQQAKEELEGLLIYVSKLLESKRNWQAEG